MVKVAKDGGSTLKHFDVSIKHHFEGKNLNHGPNGPSKSIAKNSPICAKEHQDTYMKLLLEDYFEWHKIGDSLYIHHQRLFITVIKRSKR